MKKGLSPPSQCPFPIPSFIFACLFRHSLSQEKKIKNFLASSHRTHPILLVSSLLLTIPIFNNSLSSVQHLPLRVHSMTVGLLGRKWQGGGKKIHSLFFYNFNFIPDRSASNAFDPAAAAAAAALTSRKTTILSSSSINLCRIMAISTTSCKPTKQP